MAWCFAGSVNQKSSGKRNTPIPNPVHVCQRVSHNSSRSGQDRKEPRTGRWEEDAQKGRQTLSNDSAVLAVSP